MGLTLLLQRQADTKAEDLAVVGRAVGGLRALDRTDTSKALSSFEEAAALCPDESRFALYVVYGEHLVAPGDDALRARALEHVERACANEPELPTAHLLRAWGLSTRIIEALPPNNPANPNNGPLNPAQKQIYSSDLHPLRRDGRFSAPSNQPGWLSF